jgi:hypothetical protein
MSLFQCDNCGCCENTALSSQGCHGFFEKYFDWSYAPERKGMKLCSACAPTSFNDGDNTGLGKWHGQFPQVFLPKGEFITDARGNLVHCKSGIDASKFECEEKS